MKRITKKPETSERCKDCALHYDPHEIGHDGKPFLARCPYLSYSVFLEQPACKDIERYGK